MTRLLLVDDDAGLRRSVQLLMQSEGLSCAAVGCAAEARSRLQHEAYDLILLDVNLPDCDGMTLCRQVRKEHLTPIVMLTARTASTDKVVGLELGADDYVTKPFVPEELIARVRALLRRTGEYNEPRRPSPVFQIGAMTLNTDSRELTQGGRTVALTRREFELLHLLARHRDKALSAEWIYEQLWGCSAGYGFKSLVVYVQRLRRKIEADPAQPLLLQTVRGFGYKLVSGSPRSGAS